MLLPRSHRAVPPTLRSWAEATRRSASSIQPSRTSLARHSCARRGTAPTSGWGTLTVGWSVELAPQNFELALRIAPADTETHRLLAVTHSMSAPSRAAEQLEAALALAPAAVELRFELGVAQQQTGALHEAARTYDALLARQPAHMQAHANRGTTLRDLGRHSEAAAAYATSLRLAPAFAAVYNNLALTLSNDLRRPAEALPLLAAGAALAPTWSDWGVNLGFALQRLRRREEADATLALTLT